ncbi:hypothetical protein B0H19DRAFT_1083447 [Mycena capillaripes]|nr:hypothetical protein B0H19DRAFT_1083447 [Mycena capillaripes]
MEPPHLLRLEMATSARIRTDISLCVEFAAETSEIPGSLVAEAENVDNYQELGDKTKRGNASYIVELAHLHRIRRFAASELVSGNFLAQQNEERYDTISENRAEVRDSNPAHVEMVAACGEGKEGEKTAGGDERTRDSCRGDARQMGGAAREAGRGGVGWGFAVANIGLADGAACGVGESSARLDRTHELREHAKKAAGNAADAECNAPSTPGARSRRGSSSERDGAFEGQRRRALTPLRILTARVNEGGARVEKQYRLLRVVPGMCGGLMSRAGMRYGVRGEARYRASGEALGVGRI